MATLETINIARTRRECCDAWVAHSESRFAGWLELPSDDRELVTITETYMLAPSKP